MQTMPRETTETSVSFSLAELARLERDRQRDEEQRRARAREARAAEERKADAERQRAEERRAIAESEARRQRERETAETSALTEARARAVVEVARIEAEAKTRLEAANAQRTHELAMLRVRAEKGLQRTHWALAAALGLTCSLAALGLYGAARKNERLEQDLTRLSQEKTDAVQKWDEAQRRHLDALDRWHEVLGARPLDSDVRTALEEAVALRRSIGDTNAREVGLGAVKGLEPSKVAAYAAALGDAQRRLDTARRRATLDQRFSDLTALAARHRGGNVAAALAAAAAIKARPSGDSSTLARYERALDGLRDSLAASSITGNPAGAGPATVHVTTGHSRQPPCADGDPMCDSDGPSI